jgi:hypothetical protein
MAGNIPVTIPSGPLPVDQDTTDKAELIVARVAQVFEYGTTGISPVTPATLTPDGTDPLIDHLTGRPKLKPLVIDTPQQQLYYRQLATALVTVLGAGSGGIGPVGPQGPPGSQGTQGLPGLVWCGTWAADVTYHKDDAVEFNGSSYVATSTSTGAPPANTGSTVPNTGWDLLVEKGVDGSGGTTTIPFTCTITGGGEFETGQHVSSPSFSFTYSRTPETALLTDSRGNPAINVVGLPSAVSPHLFESDVPDSEVIFTLSATLGAESAVATTKMAWRQLVYWGTGPENASGDAFIRALANNQLAASRARTFTVDASIPTHAIYYAYRAAYGPAVFTVGGIEGGFVGPYLVAVTNQFGITEDYYLYESTHPGLGPTTVMVS